MADEGRPEALLRDRRAGHIRPGVALNAPRVLLVESLDAAGSDRADARERCSALRSLRAVVRVVVMHADGAPPGLEAGQAISTPGAFAEWDSGSAGCERLREFAREGRFDLVLLASAAHGGGALARALKGAPEIRWWPTGLVDAPGWGARWKLGRTPAFPALSTGPSTDVTPPGLTWSSVSGRPVGRGRLTLWDGEYLLSPLPLAGEDGSRLLGAFEGLDEEWCALDLVVLGEPQVAFEREARARGIGPRVHFVGRAPREAEWAWWANARGAVIGGRGAVSGGLLLRGLEAGCPMMVQRSDPTGAAIARWLVSHASVLATEAGEEASVTLARLLERSPAIDELRARGRTLAAQHDGKQIASRLAEALPMLEGRATARPRPAAAA